MGIGCTCILGEKGGGRGCGPSRLADGCLHAPETHLNNNKSDQMPGNNWIRHFFFFISSCCYSYINYHAYLSSYDCEFFPGEIYVEIYKAVPEECQMQLNCAIWPSAKLDDHATFIINCIHNLYCTWTTIILLSQYYIMYLQLVNRPSFLLFKLKQN